MDYLRNERAYERRLRKQDIHLPDDSIIKEIAGKLYKPELDKLTEVDVRWCGIPFVERNGLLLPCDIANKDGWGAQTTACGSSCTSRDRMHMRMYLNTFDDDLYN